MWPWCEGVASTSPHRNYAAPKKLMRPSLYIYIYAWLYMYIHSHPEVDEIWKFQQYSHFDDLVWHFHILSTPGLVHMGSHPPKSKYWELVQLMFPGRLRCPLPLNIYNNICYISIIVSYPLISWVPSVHFLEHLCSKTCFCRMHISWVILHFPIGKKRNIGHF